MEQANQSLRCLAPPSPAESLGLCGPVRAPPLLSEQAWVSPRAGKSCHSPGETNGLWYEAGQCLSLELVPAQFLSIEP